MHIHMKEMWEISDLWLYKSESHDFEKMQMQEIQKCQMWAASEVGSMQFGAPDLYFLYVWP